MVKKLISRFGGFLLETAIVTSLIFLVFRSLPAGNGTYGVGNVLGSKIDSNGINYEVYVDSAAVAKVLGRAKPELKFYPYDTAGNRIQIVTGKDVNLAEYFQGTDAEGTAIEDIKICSITDKSGSELLSDNLSRTDTFQFSNSGVYRMKVIATDSKNQYVIKLFCVPVVESIQEG